MEHYIKNKISQYEPISFEFMASKYKKMCDPINSFTNVDETYTSTRFKAMIVLLNKHHIKLPYARIFHQYIRVGYLLISNKKAQTLIDDCISSGVWCGDLLCLYINDIKKLNKYAEKNAKYINSDNLIHRQPKTIIDIQLHYINTCAEFDTDYKYKSIMDVLDTEEKRSEDVLRTLLLYMHDVQTLARIVSKYFTKYDIISHICNSRRYHLHEIIPYLDVSKLSKDKIMELLKVCKVRKIAGDLLAWWGFAKIDHDINKVCLMNTKLGVPFLNMLTLHYAQIYN